MKIAMENTRLEKALEKPCSKWKVTERETVAAWLVNECLDSFVKFAFGHVGQIQLAEDLVQESFLAALGCTFDPGKYRGEKCALTNYLFFIIARSAARKRRSEQQNVSLESMPDPIGKEALQQEQVLGLDDIKLFVQDLPFKYQQAIQLVYLEERPLIEAASRMTPSCSEANMKVIIFRARQKLRRIIAERERK